MTYNVGDDIIGTVYEVKPYGLFLKFDDQTKGLLHISELSDSYIRDIEKYATVGDQLKVRILNIEPSNGFLKLSYKRIPNEEKYNTHSKDIRSRPISNENDFKPLKEKLNDWINDALKEINNDKNWFSQFNW